MLFVSTRKDLDNEDEIGQTSYWDVDIDHQMATGSLPILLEDLQARIQGKTVLILVHGFNNEFEDIVRAYDMIGDRVKRFLDKWYHMVIGFTWPGGNSPVDWYEPKKRAGTVAPRLARFLRDIRGNVKNVDLMSHSLGGRVVLSALKLVPEDTVRANFMMASAVDNEVLEPGEKYFVSVKHAATESLVFHSKHDFVLSSAYRIAEWDNPLGLFGPENPATIMDSLPEVYVANSKSVIKGHGDYKDSDEIYQFIHRWMNGEINEQFATL